MRSLDRKLVRDLWLMKGQALAICLVIASGVATFVMSLSTLYSLEQTQQTYYERYRFAEVFTHMKRAPLTLLPRIAEIPGVARVEARVVVDVTLDVEGLLEPAVGRIISVPDSGLPALNAIHLRAGRYLEPGHGSEVLVGESFALAHGLEPGDSVVAIINGRRDVLKIVGIALSPEYVLQIRGGDLLPDDKRFGIFWMGYTELASAFDMDGAFNDVSVSLMRGASEPEVIRRLDTLTEPYGGSGAYGRIDQLSHRFLSDEIKQLKSMALIAPTIFLSVASFLLNVVLSRQINTQREQIAALKAFGYTRVEVGWHYIKLVLLIVTLGVVLGSLVGAWMGRNLTELYTRFYKFPLFEFHAPLWVILAAAAISSTAGVLGTFASVRRAMRLPPAEAMRPEPPADYRPTFVERTGLGGLFSPAARMILRHLERQPFKAAVSTLGIATAAAVLVLGNFTEDAVNYMIDFQFQLAQRQDMTITFVEPATARALYEVEHLPGVMAVEPFRSVAARLRAGHRERRVGIMGLEPENRLFRVIDRHERGIRLPPEGLVVSEKLAEVLDVEVGDEVTIEVLEGQRPVRSAVVAGLIADYSGLNAYMDVHALHRLMREGRSLSGAFLMVDSKHVDTLYTTLKETPQVAGVTVKEAALKSFEDTVAENLLRMKLFNVMFASIIAFGVVYNSARISLAERSRELATLRVIGFTRAEVSMVLLGELAALTLVAIPIGLFIGYLFAFAASLAMDNELYRIPLVVDRATYGFAAAVVMLATLLSGLVVRRRIDRLDLVEVLKSTE